MPPLTAANDLIRARNVTASEVGALLGKHPYSTPLSIYNRLSSPVPDPERTPNEAMALGVFFERRIAQYTALKLGMRLRANIRSIEHPLHSLCATPDYFVIGQRMLVEVKLSSKLYVWTEETLQEYIEWQARAQMACTNRDSVIIAALVGSTYYSPIVVRDYDKERRMLQAVDDFMHNHMFSGNPPDIEQTRLRFAQVEG